MKLIDDLNKARTEEDVKDAYIRALGLKGVSKNLIDIQTNEIWFEAKGKSTPSVHMFAQLMFYVRKDFKDGKPLPNLLAVIDTEKAAIIATDKVLELIKDKTIVWPKNGSSVKEEKELIAKISPTIQTYYSEYDIRTNAQDFIDRAKAAIRDKQILKANIIKSNLRHVFDSWVDMIGKEIEGVQDSDYALLFYADIMLEGQKPVVQDLPAKVLFSDDKPSFILRGKLYELASVTNYRKFWSIYHRPPESNEREYLLSRRDSLLPITERAFKGAYYTPFKVVDRAYELLNETLGDNWQDEYIVWDMCCGTGNLEMKHTNYRNLYMSTLDQSDVDIMKSNRTCIGASIFQYDYLNDDIDDFGNIDYAITNKIPTSLRQAIADAKNKKKNAKKILVLMNPPYAEATNANNQSIGLGAKNKAGVSKTKCSENLMDGYGKSTNELFTQFIARIQLEIPNARLGMFSTLKYVNAPNFQDFRKKWFGEFRDGFIVHSIVFEGINGDFPIGFLIWNLEKKLKISEIQVAIFDKNLNQLGFKMFYNQSNETLLNVWANRPKANNQEVVPLKNAISPTPGKVRVMSWSNNAIGYLYSCVNDLQNAGQRTALLSSVYGGGNGFYVTKDNLWKSFVVFSVRRLIVHCWTNHNDQFCQPTEMISPGFKNDCLVWALFNGKNLSAGADGLEWNGKKWSLVNHFVPFTESEVNARERFESHFMIEYIQDLDFSPEARAVLDAGREIWRHYHSNDFNHKIRAEFKLNRSDVGWYQIRKAIEANSENHEYDFKAFKSTYENLSAKLRPKVYELGFLK